MNPLQTVVDRMDITDTLTQYSHVVDQRRWEDWPRVFTEDAIVDYSGWGMEPCSPAALIAGMQQSHQDRLSGQHLLHNHLITVDVDTAQARTEFTLHAVMRGAEPGRSRMRSTGGWYEDELVRTERGWRIRRRRSFGKWLVSSDVPTQESVITPSW